MGLKDFPEVGEPEYIPFKRVKNDRRTNNRVIKLDTGELMIFLVIKLIFGRLPGFRSISRFLGE